jgi:hypothetical protein
MAFHQMVRWMPRYSTGTLQPPGPATWVGVAVLMVVRPWSASATTAL